MPKKPRFFYGYWIIAVTFMGQFIMNGFRFYAFGLFTIPLQDEFSWGRGEIMLALTLSTLVTGISGPIIGMLLHRYGPKPLMVTGALVGTIGFILLSRVNILLEFYIYHAICGLGFALMTFLPASYLILNWFDKRRGWALGVMGIGVGAGGFVMSPIIGGYIIPAMGWRLAYLFLGILSSVIMIPLVLFVVKTRPADMGLLPDGTKAPVMESGDKASSPKSEEGFTLRESMKTWAFWLITISYALFSLPMMAILQNAVPHLTDIGYPVAMASTALGFIGVGSAIGKFGFGWISDYIKPRYSLSIGISLQAISAIILLTIGPETPVALIWLYVVCFGLGIGCYLPCMPLIVGQTFGLAAYGTIRGTIGMLHMVGSTPGPVLMGYIFDVTGSYRLAFIIFIIVYALSIPIMLAVRRPKLPETYPPT